MFSCTFWEKEYTGVRLNGTMLLLSGIKHYICVLLFQCLYSFIHVVGNELHLDCRQTCRAKRHKMSKTKYQIILV